MSDRGGSADTYRAQADASEPSLRCQQISHDIHHELATIMMLAAAVVEAPDVGESSRARLRLMLGETRWLDQLQRAYEAAIQAPTAPWSKPSQPIRLDTVAGEVVATMKMSTLSKIRFAAVEARVIAERLALWRALRNIVDNATRAAGPAGQVDVRVAVDGGWGVVQVDDDGPGLAAGPPGHASLGLGIVQDLTASWGGELEIRSSVAGGCSVRLSVPLWPTLASRG